MKANAKFSPMIYRDWWDLFANLPVGEKAELLKAITLYPDYEPKGIGIWTFIRSQLKKQVEHVEEKKASRTAAANARWNAKDANASFAMQKMQMDANASNAMQTDAKDANAYFGCLTVPNRTEPYRTEQEHKKKYIKKKTELLKPETVPEDLWEEFVKYRKGIKKPLTQRALNRISSEAAKACISVSQAFEIIMDNEWRGFEADWIKNKPKDDQLARYAVPKEEVERYRAELRNKEPEIRLEPDDPPEFFNDQFIQEGFRRV